jgi:hypothetical protein
MALFGFVPVERPLLAESSHYIPDNFLIYGTKKKGTLLHPFKMAWQSGMPDTRLFDGQPSNSARTC